MPQYQPQWMAGRTVSGVPTFATADSTYILNNTNNNLDWDLHTAQAAGRFIDVPAGYDTVILSAIGYHASAIDAGTCTITVLGAWDKGPAKHIASCAFVFGKQQCLEAPYPPDQDKALSTKYAWADTCVVTSTSLWPTNPTAIDSGNDRIVLIPIKTYGIKHLILEIAAVSSGVTVMPVILPVNTF